MGFSVRPVKGLSKVWVDTGIDPEALRLHISEIAPGTAAHPPHTHEGVEAFYILEGCGILETQGERYALGPNEAIVLDATHPHGLTNTGDIPMRYVVMIAGG
jgi:mannose-6-phosphate isomerase-like protein (cupin superfamily)